MVQKLQKIFLLWGGGGSKHFFVDGGEHMLSKFAITVALCCVIQASFLEWSFITTRQGHTCALIMLSNQHLSGGWIILATER